MGSAEPRLFGSLDLNDATVMHHNLHDAETERTDLAANDLEPRTACAIDPCRLILTCDR